MVTDATRGEVDREKGREKDKGPINKKTRPSASGETLESAESETKGRVGKPFVLSEGLPLVPHKLAVRILKGEYIDMAELLRDNLEAQRRATSSITQSPSPTAQKHRWEVPDLLSWVQCFGTYMAVITSKYPDRVHQLLAYQTLIVREARRCGLPTTHTSDNRWSVTGQLTGLSLISHLTR